MKKRIINVSLLLSLAGLLLLTLSGCLSMSPSDFTPYSAAKTGDLAAVKAYIEDGGRIEATSAISGDDYTLLWKAAEYGQMEVVKYLVEQGANVNALGRRRDGSNRYSPYAVALQNKHNDVADYLTEHGGTLIVQ